MSSLRTRALVICFPIIVGWLPLASRSSSYHLEFDDRIPGYEEVTLVNDSEKSIEAYEVSQACQRSNGGIGNDFLDYILGGSSNIRAADGSIAHNGVLEPGGRWRIGKFTLPVNGDCQNQVIAVLFSDGSFEGKDAAVRGLKAHRDGLAAGANYWADRVNQEKPDGSTLDALLAEVKRCIVEDQSEQRKYWLRLRYDDTPQPLWLYWSGRIQVERTVEVTLPKDLSQEKAAQSFREVADLINQWKKKIDGNLALQKLNGMFPPVSESGDRQ